MVATRISFSKQRIKINIEIELPVHWRFRRVNAGLRAQM
jgi:hypothetical protein